MRLVGPKTETLLPSIMQKTSTALPHFATPFPPAFANQCFTSRGSRSGGISTRSDRLNRNISGARQQNNMLALDSLSGYNKSTDTLQNTVGVLASTAMLNVVLRKMAARRATNGETAFKRFDVTLERAHQCASPRSLGGARTTDGMVMAGMVILK